MNLALLAPPVFAEREVAENGHYPAKTCCICGDFFAAQDLKVRTMF
jgi:hypothetical protein